MPQLLLQSCILYFALQTEGDNSSQRALAISVVTSMLSTAVVFHSPLAETIMTTRRPCLTSGAVLLAFTTDMCFRAAGVVFAVSRAPVLMGMQSYSAVWVAVSTVVTLRAAGKFLRRRWEHIVMLVEDTLSKVDRWLGARLHFRIGGVLVCCILLLGNTYGLLTYVSCTDGVARQCEAAAFGENDAIWDISHIRYRL